MKITLETSQFIEFLDRAIRATDHAETRLMVIDHIASPAIPDNSDVIATVKGVNTEMRLLRQGMEMLESDPEFVELMKRAQQIPGLLPGSGIRH